MDALLTSDDPFVLLEELSVGDPLGLRSLAHEQIEARALFLAPSRVFEESLYRVVAFAPFLEPEPDLEPWLAEQVEASLDRVLRLDEVILRGELDPEVLSDSSDYLSQFFGFEPEASLRAATRFNHLSVPMRRAYLALVVEGRSPEECAAAGLGAPRELESMVREAAEAIVAEVQAYRSENGLNGESGGQA